MTTHLSAYVYDRPVPRNAIDCPVETWLAFLGHRWTAAILWHLSEGPKRFGALEDRLIGITPKVLTDRLAALDDRGLITRTVVASFPRRATYTLTADGREIVAIVSLLEPWTKKANSTSLQA